MVPTSSYIKTLRKRCSGIFSLQLWEWDLSCRFESKVANNWSLKSAFEEHAVMKKKRWDQSNFLLYKGHKNAACKQVTHNCWLEDIPRVLSGVLKAPLPVQLFWRPITQAQTSNFLFPTEQWALGPDGYSWRYSELFWPSIPFHIRTYKLWALSDGSAMNTASLLQLSWGKNLVSYKWAASARVPKHMSLHMSDDTTKNL